MEPVKSEAGRDDASLLRGLKILVVEDNAVNQQVAKEILESWGVEVQVAGDGVRAVDEFEKKPWDCMLMDVQMPVMDGYEATRRIRKMENGSDLPIIAMTAHAMVGDREKSIEAGMNDHISKPIDPMALFQTVAKWTGKTVSGNPTPEPETGDASGPKVPSLPGIDAKKGLAIVQGNVKTYQKILSQFRKMYLDAASTLGRLDKAKEFDKAEQFAHGLKGSAGNIGALGVGGLAAEIEKWYRDGNEGLPDSLFDRFAEAVDLVAESLAGLATNDDNAKKEETASDLLNESERTEVISKVSELIGLAKSNDTKTAEIIEELVAATDGKPVNSGLSNAMQLIEDWDFESAADLLSTSLVELGARRD